MAPLIERLETGTRALIGWAALSRWRTAVVVLAIALAAVLPGLSSLPVTDRDEARFAQASKQMLETGDLIDIRLQDAPRWKKPVGIYWLQAASAQVLGGGADAGIWAYRVPSALGAVAAALLTAWAARPLIGVAGAVLAGVMMATTLLAVVEAHLAKTDAALMAAAVAALGALARLGTGTAGPGTAIAFWSAIAVSILLKGPVVPLIAALALATLWIVGRQPRLAELRPLPGLALVLLIVAPWIVAIAVISDGGFFAAALGRDLGAKLVSGQESHWGPPGLYLGLLWLTLWPWAALLPAALPWLWRQRRAGWIVLLAGWVVPFWIVLEAVPTKLPHYVLPLYPALVIALAGWIASAETPSRAARIAGAWLVAVPGAVLVALVVLLPAFLALGGAEFVLGDLPGLIPSHVSWPAIVLGLLGACALAGAARAALGRRPLAQCAASVAAALLLYPAALAFALPALGTGFPSPRLAALIAQYRPCASGPAISTGYREPSLVFLTETGLRLASPQEAGAALRSDPGALVLVEEPRRAEMGREAFEGTVVRGRVSYFNYNRGHATTAALVTPDDPRWLACAG
jgi:4-amino-4-deoxy-L-arabinose transferase-like glycosyltransferase